MRKRLLSLILLAGMPLLVGAQQNNGEERRMLSPGKPFFVPHWYVKAQVGAAYDIGEAKFSQLLSTALQVAAGYKFDELIGVRGSLSGLWARNRYAFPEVDYKWNFIQPTVEAELDLTTLFLGSNPERNFSLYAFAGGGVALAFNNKDAEEADNRYGVDFQKLWTGSRWNPVVRGGLGLDYQITDNIAIGGEVNVNMLPDHFNSKLGKNDNKDWHFNALIGLKYTIGRSRGRTEPIYEEPHDPAPQQRYMGMDVEKISFNVNIYFLIGQSVIRDNQVSKLRKLLQYLNEHPKAFIRLSGYADKETGTPEINLRLSRERSQAVSQYLQDEGIEEYRIRRFAKGDRVQPFNIPEDNRVCICFVYDPDNPVPQPFDEE